MDGGTRIRICQADEGKHEPESLSPARGFRTRQLHEGAEERRGRAIVSFLRSERSTSMEQLQKRDLLVSKAWLQAVAVVVVFGFFVLGLLAYRTYSGEAPIPGRVVDSEGRVLFTGED